MLRALEEARLKTLSLGQRAWCNRNLLLGLDRELRQMTREDILSQFSKAAARPADPKRAPKSPVNDALLMRTLIWHIYLLIEAREMDPMRGNLRSFWYRVVEPFYVNHNLLDLPPGPSLESYVEPDILQQFFFEEQKTNEGTMELFAAISEGGRHGAYILSLMASSIDDFVLQRIFSFREPWEFKDPRETFHSIGSQTASLIFFTEKEGLWWDIASPAAHEFKISAMASKGEPGYLTLEYLTAQLRNRKAHVLRVGALTDYDPWGWEIARNFKAKLEEPAFGYPNDDGSTTPFQVDLKHLTSLDLFDKDVIQNYKRDLSKVPASKRKEVNDWMRETHGIDGKPFSLHVDNANRDKIWKAIEKWKKDADKQAQIDKRKARPERRDRSLKLR